MCSFPAGCGGTWVCHALVDDDDGDVELFGQADQVAQMLAELLLALRQLAAAGELDAEEGDDGVDDEDAERALVSVSQEGGDGLSMVGGWLGERGRWGGERGLGVWIENEWTRFTMLAQRKCTLQISICSSCEKTRHTTMLSNVCSPSRPKRSAMASTRSGRKLP